jgi:hypothetical protein
VTKGLGGVARTTEDIEVIQVLGSTSLRMQFETNRNSCDPKAHCETGALSGPKKTANFWGTRPLSFLVAERRGLHNVVAGMYPGTRAAEWFPKSRPSEFAAGSTEICKFVVVLPEAICANTNAITTAGVCAALNGSRKSQHASKLVRKLSTCA